MKKLLAALTPSRSLSASDKIRAEVRGVQDVLRRVEASLDVAAAAYAENPSETTSAERDRRTIARDRATRDVRTKQEALDRALQVEADPANRAFYDETVRERAAVEAWLRDRYDLLARELGEGIARLVEVEHRSEEANRRLPTGAEPLDGLEHSIRRGPSSTGRELRWTARIPRLTSGELNFWPNDEID